MRQRLFFVLVLVLTSSAAVDAECVDPATLAHSTVGITRYFDDTEKAASPGVSGIAGTGWFVSPTSMVTVEHVAAAMNLSTLDWKQVEIRTGETEQSIPVRIQRLAGSSAEKIAVLELQTAFPDAQGIALRMEPLVPGEPVVSLAYPGRHLRVAGGRFVQYGKDDKFAGTALLELYDGNDRLVLDHGASGAPVLDCRGRAVAVVGNLMTTTIRFMSQVVRVSTAWQNPNVVAIPVQVMKDHPAPVE